MENMTRIVGLPIAPGRNVRPSPSRLNRAHTPLAGPPELRLKRRRRPRVWLWRRQRAKRGSPPTKCWC
jgi:hypothetical protein